MSDIEIEEAQEEFTSPLKKKAENKTPQRYKKSKETHFETFSEAKTFFTSLQKDSDTYRKRVRRRNVGFDVVQYVSI